MRFRLHRRDLGARGYLKSGNVGIERDFKRRQLGGRGDWGHG